MEQLDNSTCGQLENDLFPASICLSFLYILNSLINENNALLYLEHFCSHLWQLRV